MFTHQRVKVFHFALLLCLFLRLAFQWFFTADELSRADTYGRVGHWIESSVCTVKTGSFLTVCSPDGTLAPIENVSLADDRGHTMVANAHAYIFGQPISRLALTRFNLAFNFLAVLLLLRVLFANGHSTAAVLFALVQAIVGFERFGWGPDAQGIYTGLSHLSAALLIHLSGALESTKEQKKKMYLAPASGAFVLTTLALIGTFREPMGLVSALSCAAVLLFIIVVTIVVTLRRNPGTEPKTAILPTLVPALVLVLALPLAPKIITRSALAARDRLFTVAPSMGVSSHGIAHSLYIGLGARPNPWGIRWDDTSAVEAVQRVKSGVDSASPEYFDILWREYFKIVRENPVAVLDIYVRKLLKSLEIIFRNGWMIVLFWLVTLAPIRFHGKSAPPRSSAAKLALFGLTLLFLGGLVQGVLGSPGESFLIPAMASAEVLFIVAGAGRLNQVF